LYYNNHIKMFRSLTLRSRPFTERFLGISNNNKLSSCDVIKSIDRRKFMRGVKEYHSSLSSAYVHKFCLDLVYDKLTPTSKILDIGTGTGFLTTCFAKLGGTVIGMEHVDELSKIAKQNIKECGCGNFVIYTQDYRKGLPNIKFDVINIGGSVETWDNNILKQLAPGGVLIASIGKGYSDQKFFKVTKKDNEGSGIRHMTNSCKQPLSTTNSCKQPLSTTNFCETTLEGDYKFDFITDEFAFAPLTDLKYQLSREYLFNPFNQK
jgi:protein-L-isoaspartate O-methyltransferase